MGDIINNLPTDNKLNPSKTDIDLVSIIFKSNENENQNLNKSDTPILPISSNNDMNKNNYPVKHNLQYEKGLIADFKESLIGLSLFIILSLPPIDKLFTSFTKGNILYAWLIKIVLFLVLFILLKRKFLLK